MTIDSRTEFTRLKKLSVTSISNIMNYHLDNIIEMYNILKQTNYTEDNKLSPGYVDLFLYLTQIKYIQKYSTEDSKIDELMASEFGFPVVVDKSDKEIIRDAIVLQNQNFDFVIYVKELEENDYRVYKIMDIYWCCKENEKQKFKHYHYPVPTVHELLNEIHLEKYTPLYKIKKTIYKSDEMNNYDYDVDDNKFVIYDLQHIESFVSTFETLLIELKDDINEKQVVE